MNKADKEIREAVDRLLFEQGTYTPLELLLAEGRLMYADYEAWRGGRCDYLEELLFGDPEQSYDLMKRAEAYARALALAPETQRYISGEAHQAHSLRFCSASAPDRCFHTGYRRDDEVPQLDLLMDSAGVALANGINRALVQRDEVEARRLLDRLFEIDPGHRQLGGLERLVVAGSMTSPVEDAGLELSGLQRELCPLAEEILGPGARHFLAPQWQRLTRALLDVDFDPDNPGLHSSYSALRAEDWGQVIASVEAQSNWEEQSELLCRHAQACGRMHLDSEAISDWFRLCWRFPDEAARIGNEAEPQWRRYWLRFLELDSELPNRDFPAWVLIEQPGLARWLATERCFDDIDVPEDYRITAELVQAKPSPFVNAGLVDKRKLLQVYNPELFACYLRH
ncbi:MAG: hypothetical protein U9R74_15375 [Pseudomonadota bacterium]|nr:hypothetical protein [Pseudomonadota bacterium]